MDYLVSQNDSKAKSLVLLESELENSALNSENPKLGSTFSGHSLLNLTNGHNNNNYNNQSFTKSLCRSHYRSKNVDYLSLNDEKDASQLHSKISKLMDEIKVVEESILLEVQMTKMISNKVEELRKDKVREV